MNKDYWNIQEDHEALELAYENLEKYTIKEWESMNKLDEKEKEIHSKYFSQVLDWKMTIWAFEKLLKFEAYKERLDYRKWQKLKALAKQKVDRASEKLNVTKKLINF